MENQETVQLYLTPIYALGISLYISAGDNEMNTFNLACDFCRRHSYSSWRENTFGLYLLRGKSTVKENLLIALLEVPVLPESLQEVLSYIQFYNQHGTEVYKSAKKGEDYQACILRNLERDCAVVIKCTAEQYSCGSGQSHVWIAERISGKRILLIHF